MKVVEQSFSFVSVPTDACAIIESVGRDAYDSHDKTKDGSAEPFCIMLRDKKPIPHTAVFEFADIIIKVKTDRNVSHELIRSRLASYLQSSQRYIRYTEDMEFIKPAWADQIPGGYQFWKESMEQAEANYAYMLGGLGMKAQQARTVLTSSKSTIINMKHNVRGWRETLELRTGPGVYPEMRNLMATILAFMNHLFPALFGDIYEGLAPDIKEHADAKCRSFFSCLTTGGDITGMSIDCVRP